MCHSSDKKNAFTGGLVKLGEKVKNRFYTNALSFVGDLSTVFSAGISNEPSISSDTNEADQTSPSKKHPMDMKERKRLAKRIIKSVQPQLENAVRVEAEISGQPIELALEELERLLETSFQVQNEIVSIIGAAVSLGDAGAEVEMIDADRVSQNETILVNGDSSEFHQEDQEPNGNEDHIDVEMEDVDAPHELDDDAIMVATSPSDLVGDTITTAALAEVNGNISPMKNNHPNGVKNEATPPATNGANSAVSSEEIGPPTPPISTGDLVHDQGMKVLADGGIPQYLLKDFSIDGTQVSEIVGSFMSVASHASEVLSDMDDDELNALQPTIVEADKGVVASGSRPSPTKTKKGKGKKKRFGGKAR
jgi:NuA3 HAT complex component NTO1